MGAFLGKILAAVTPAFLGFIYEKLASLVSQWLAKRRIAKEAEEKKRADEAKNAQAREASEKAVTQEERESAAEQASKNF